MVDLGCMVFFSLLFQLSSFNKQRRGGVSNIFIKMMNQLINLCCVCRTALDILGLLMKTNWLFDVFSLI